MSDQDDVFDTALLAEAQRDGVEAEAAAADSDTADTADDADTPATPAAP
ncbi:MAG: hypothetical protein V9F04_12910 [Dermatophilaceae bacterium]